MARVRHTRWPQPILDGLEKLAIGVQPFLLFSEGVRRGVRLPDVGVTTRRLAHRDLAEIVASAQRPLTVGQLEARLARGQQGLGLEVDGRLAAFTWWDLADCHWEGLPFRLERHEAYLFDAYTFPSFRGRGLAPLLRHAAYRELADGGRTSLYSITDRFNTPAARFKEKLGATIVASGVYFAIGGLRRCVGLRGAEPRLVEAARAVGRGR